MVSLITLVYLGHTLGKSITSPKGKEKNAPSRSSQLRSFGLLGASKLNKFFQGHLAMQSIQKMDALMFLWLMGHGMPQNVMFLWRMGWCAT
jgi:hypothetical protein